MNNRVSNDILTDNVINFNIFLIIILKNIVKFHHYLMH